MALGALLLGACAGDSLVLPEDREPAALVILSGEGQVDTVGRALRDSLVVRLTDPAHRPIMHQVVRFLEPAEATGAHTVPGQAETDADGRAIVRLVLGTVAGAQTIRARVGASGGALTADVVVRALPAAADTLQAVSGDGQSGIVGSALGQLLVARVTDGFGNPVRGITASWAPVGGGSVSPSTSVSDSNGRVATRRILGATPGAPTTIVTVPGLKGSPVEFIQTAMAGPPADLIPEAGDAQVGLPGQPLGTPLRVRLVDALGNGLEGQAVNWSVATGGGTLSATSGTTDAAGRASTTLTLGPVAGANVVISSSGGITATFSASSSPSQPTTLTATSATQASGIAGALASPAPSVRVTDALGRPVAGVPVTFAVTGGGGSVAPPTVASDLNGNATAALWTLGSQVGSNTLVATASGAAGPLNGSPIQFTINATAGAGSRLSVVQEPASSAVSGVPLSQVPRVQVEDANGNPVGDAGIVVTATLAGSPAGASLAAASATTTTAGIAVFSGLTLSGPAGTYALLFTSSPPLAGATSADIALSAALAYRLVITVQPSAVVASGQPFPRQPELQVVDAAGNPVSQAGISSIAALASGSPALGGTLTATTNSSGVAAFSDLQITGVAGQRTLRFSAAGMAPVTSGAIDVQGGGTGSGITMLVQPSASTANGTAFPIQPVALVRDQQGFPVGGVSVSAAIASGNGALGGQLTVTTNFLGIATFSGLSLSGTVGSYTLAIAGAGATVTTNAIQLTPGAASPGQSTANVPSKGKQDKQTVITVQARDQSGNALVTGGSTVGMTVSGKNSAGPLTATDNGDGSYTVSYTPTRKGNDDIDITLDGVPIAGSPFTSDVH